MTIFARGLVFACVLGFSAVSGAADKAKSDAHGPFLKGDVKAGEAKAATCGACHGPGGNSTNPVWPKIAGQGAPYAYAQLKAFKRGAGQAAEADEAVRKDPVMSAQAAALSDQDMQDLAVYFASQNQKPGVASEDSIAIAEPLYRAGDADRGIPACSGCHGPAGAGNPAASYPRVGGQHADYAAKQLKAYRAGERSGGRNGQMMAEVAAELTDEEIAALASYINGLQ